MRTLSLALLVSVVALAPSCNPAPAPFPEASIVVDTDLPVPQLASRLRVDVFDGRGAWRSSRDFALRSPDDLPASFSIFLPDENASEDVLVRLRLRPDAAERDYRGERYRPPAPDDAPPEAVVAVPAGDGQPRLLVRGEDRTPSSEPLPELTVDRLVRVTLAPGTASKTRVVLRTACMGRMANLVESTACIDAEHLLDMAGSGDGADEGRPSLAGTFLGSEDLEPPELPAGTVGIAGGAFVLGGDELDVGIRAAEHSPTFPPRAAIIRGFAIDREEVSVARMRAAIAGGFAVAGALHPQTGPLATSSADPLASCTFRETPDPADAERELLPVTCVGFETARAFCRRAGGDLPTEAQWEYAAAAAGRARKTRYPWGNEAPTCEGVVFARFDRADVNGTACYERGFPFGLRGAANVTGDVTRDGVRGLAGAASEWVRGAPLPYDSACYERGGLVDPACEARTEERTVRGGAFSSIDADMVATFRGRVPAGGSTPAIGFRCVHGR